MISYLLAGAEAYSKVFEEIGIHVYYRWLILPFSVTFTLLIIYGTRILHSIISSLTLVKGGMLVLMVAITGLVGTQTQLDVSTTPASIRLPLKMFLYAILRPLLTNDC